MFASPSRSRVSAGRLALPPVSIAGLPDKRACVCVGPPLLASAPSPGLATFTWLLLTPLVKPPAPPVPIRLNELAASTVPLMSSAASLAPSSLKLPATIVFLSVVVPADAAMPPPVPVELLSLSALLFLMVLLMLVIVPPSTTTPPPLPLALLPLMVTALVAALGPLIVRFLLIAISPPVNVIVCGVENAPAVSNVIIAPSQASAIIWRREPAPLSAVVVTRVPPQTWWLSVSLLVLKLVSPA